MKKPPPASKDKHFTKDTSLRAAILLTATSYGTRGDHDGDLISKVLHMILSTASHMDAAIEEGEE